MATGCPSLHRLSLQYPLQYRKRAAQGGSPTTNALVVLARQCASLSSLYLSSIRMGEADYSAVDALPVLDHGLQILGFAELNCASEKVSAMIIDRLFPRLDIPRSQAGYQKPPTEPWAAVLAQLESFHYVRKQESQRATQVCSPIALNGCCS